MNETDETRLVVASQVPVLYLLVPLCTKATLANDSCAGTSMEVVLG